MAMAVPLSQTLCPSRPSIPCRSVLRRNSQSSTCYGGGESRWLNQRSGGDRRGLRNFAAECANLGSSAAVAVEMRELEEEAADWMKEGRLREKCGGGGRGVVELLECLEREAIMGEDQGRDPNDYNRRAQIFDRSSRVFQALKETETSSTTTTTVTEV